MVLSGQVLATQGIQAALANPLQNFFGGNLANRGGIRVIAKDLDFNGLTDIVTGDGVGGTITGYDNTGAQLFQTNVSDDTSATGGVYLG